MNHNLESTRINDVSPTNMTKTVQSKFKSQISRNIFDDSIDHMTETIVSGYPEEYALSYEGVSIVEDYKLESFKPIPADVTNKMNDAKHRMFGFLPLLSRAYAVADCALFVWDYSLCRNIIQIDESHGILAVTAFQAHQLQGQHCLLVATSKTIRMIFVAFEQSQHNHQFNIMSISPEQMCYQIGYSTFCCASSTADGRVFLADKAGLIYQFTYNISSLFWGANVCRLDCVSSSRIGSYILTSIPFLSSPLDCAVELKIDDSINLLYLLLESGDIQIYDISNGKISQVRGIDLMSYVTKLKHLGLENAGTVGRVTKIQPITQSESKHLNLVAVTVIGIRLYFQIVSNRQFVPYRLFHIRFPPAILDASLTRINMCSHYRGCFVMAGLEADNSSPLFWALFTDENRNFTSLNERLWIISDVGRVLSLEHVPSNSRVQSEEIVDNESYYEFMSPSRILVMSEKGVVVLRHLRFVDRLERALEDVNSFLHKFSSFSFKMRADEIVAMCLSIYVDSSSSHVRNNSLEIIQLLCSRRVDSSRTDLMQDTNSSFVSNLPADYSNITLFTASTLWIRQFLKPILSLTLAKVVYDNKLGKFKDQMRSTWGRLSSSLGRLFAVPSSRLEDSYLANLIDISQLHWIRSRINTMIDLCENKLEPLMNSLLDSHESSPRAAVFQDAFNLYLSARDLLFSSGEVLGFWCVLCYEGLDVLTAFIQKDVKQFMGRATVNLLVAEGYEVIQHMLRLMLTFRMDNMEEVKQLNHRLTTFCPSLHSSHNALCLEATSKLVEARKTTDDNKRRNLVEDAFSIFNEFPSGVDLNLVFNYVYELRVFPRAVPLCLRVSSAIDPQDCACDHYSTDLSKLPSKTVLIINKRTECHRELIGLVERVRADCDNQSKDFASQTSAKTIFDDMLQQILTCRDQLLLFTTYEWLCSVGLFDTLISVDSFFLGDFLAHKYKRDTKLSAVLIRYYEHNNQLLKAAKLLLDWAEGDGPNVGLDDRIDLLYRAVVCINSSPANSDKFELLTRVEHTLKVGRAQKIVIAESLMRGKAEASVLESGIVSTEEELFDDYIFPLGLVESQLKVMHVLGRYDLESVLLAWHNVFEEITTNSPNEAETGDYLVELARSMMLDVKYIPIDLLSELLEIVSFSFSFNPSWVSDIFFRIEFPLNLLLENYFQLITERNPFLPGRPAGCLRLMSSLILVLKRFLQVPEIVRDERSVDEFFSDIHCKINSLVSFVKDMFDPLTVELSAMVDQFDQFSESISEFICS